MKVYVDEMPEDCWHCPCFRPDLEQPCWLGDDFEKNYYRGDDAPDDAVCPLRSLEDYTYGKD